MLNGRHNACRKEARRQDAWIVMQNTQKLENKLHGIAHFHAQPPIRVI